MSTSIIIGRHAVKQFLSSDGHVEKLFLRDRQKTNHDLKMIIKLAKDNGIQVQWLPPYKFDDRFQGDHQGIACITHNFKQQNLTELIDNSPPVIVVLDHLNDPHNFGAICRSAEAFGMTNVIYPKNRAVQITPTVAKASAGAIENITFTKITNIRQALSELKKSGYWIYAASSNEGQSLDHTDFNYPMVLICGAEETGVSPGLVKLIDEFVHIPMKGKTSSLNVSVATGIILNKIASQI
jgi:23S rRNA (guanosine2251-2'-O)-methyltransferase